MSQFIRALCANRRAWFALLVVFISVNSASVRAGTLHWATARHAKPSARATFVDRAAVEARRAESTERIRDITLAGITANAWRWYVSLPTAIAGDTNSINCGVSQEGPFWYLGPPFGESSTTTCTIPTGKTIVAFVAGYLSNNCPGDFDGNPVPNAQELLGDYAASQIDPLVGPAAELDNQRLRVRRIVSDVFAFTAGDDWAKIPDGCFTGSPQIAVSDGYFVFIPPLARGDHILTLSLTDPATTGVFKLKIR